MAALPVPEMHQRSAVREYLPDILMALGFAALLAGTRLRFPAKFGFVMTMLLRRLRVTPTRYHIIVSLDGVPHSVWSVRIPRRNPQPEEKAVEGKVIPIK